MIKIIGICQKVKDEKGNPTKEVLGIVTKRKAKRAKSCWGNSLGPGWKITIKKT